MEAKSLATRSTARETLAQKYAADTQRVRARLELVEAPTMKHEIQQQVRTAILSCFCR